MGTRKLYLPGLHGLRFIVAFLVWLGHLQSAIEWKKLAAFPFKIPDSLPADGVTLFFALSGFLITYLLLKERAETGTVALKAFYIRRILRIWPLYFLFTFLTFFVLNHIEFLHYPNLDMAIDERWWPRLALYSLLSAHVAIVLYGIPGVGGPLWSIGVEEYFYFLWPLLVKAAKERLPWALVGVMAVPICIRYNSSQPVYQLFWYLRIDCMAVGALAAWLSLRHPGRMRFLFPLPVQLAAYGLLAWNLLMPIRQGSVLDRHYELYHALLSLNFLVIVLNVAFNPRTVLGFENRFFRYMGEISYGFYVFQWLCNVIVLNTLERLGGIEHQHLRSLVVVASDFVLTTAMASLSYHFWEKRFLLLKRRHSAIVTGVAALEPFDKPREASYHGWMDAPARSLRRKALLFAVWLAYLSALMVGAVAVIRYVFPTNRALEFGRNPALLSQQGMGEGSEANNKLTQFKLFPYTGFHSHPSAEEEGRYGPVAYRYRTNNYGFLTRQDFQPFNGHWKKAPNERVVLLTGGSAAWGQGASSNETSMAYVLERLLRQEDPEHAWTVVNLANRGWIAYQEYIALDLYGTEMNPDWIVAYDGRNDMYVPLEHGEGVPNHYFFTGQKRLNELFETEFTQPADGYMPFLKFRRLAERVQAITQPPPPPQDREFELVRAVRFYLHSMESIARRFREQKLLFVTQAATGAYLPGHLLDVAYRQILPRMSELVKSHPHVTHLNGVEFFQPGGLSPYFVDDCHLTDAGQAVIARHMADAILSAETRVRGLAATGARARPGKGNSPPPRKSR
ncbi:MAG TPA: acyltransferase [Bdellovibrionota bacterium]|nr:acyltransferase [Bdellovibrionota bacterium]